MKKVLMVFAVLLAIAGISGSVYFYIQYSKISSEREVLVQQNAVLQSSIDAIGPTTTVYTVADTVTTRDVVHSDDFVEILMPVSNITEDTVTDISKIEGMLYKVEIQPGTPITKSMLMLDEYTDTLFTRDLMFDYLPLGLQVGDFVDVQITFPFGQTFTVIPHLRVDQLVVEANVIKTHMTTWQWALWTSARKDYALYNQQGLSLYLSKYLEPGVDSDAIVAFYPVRQEMEAVVNVDPNIKEAELCVNSVLREQIDYMLETVADEEGGMLNSGIGGEAAAINGAVTQYYENSTGTGTSTIDETNNGVIDLESASSTLNEASDALNRDTAPGVTDSQRTESLGSSLFGDETVLE